MKTYLLHVGFAVIVFALAISTLPVESRPSVPPGHEVACGGLLRGAIRGAGRAIGVQRRQERRASGAGLFGRAC